MESLLFGFRLGLGNGMNHQKANGERRGSWGTYSWLSFPAGLPPAATALVRVRLPRQLFSASPMSPAPASAGPGQRAHDP